MKFITATLLVVSILIAGCSDPGKSKVITINGIVSKTIPGITASDIHGNFTKKGFVLTKNIGSDFSTWTCADYKYMREYKVVASGKGPDEIVSVDITATFDNELDNETKEFLGYAASLPFKGSSPQAAKDWVIENINGGLTRFGDVTYKLSSSNNSRILKMYVE